MDRKDLEEILVKVKEVKYLLSKPDDNFMEINIKLSTIINEINFLINDKNIN